MDLGELVDDRNEIFARPKTKKAVVKGRTDFISIKSFEDIVSKLERRKPGQVGIIEFPIIPSNFYSAQNFSKRGPLVELETFGGDEEKLKREEWSEVKARIRASERYSREKGPYVGWMWKDPEARAHILHPTTNVEGQRILIAGIKSRNITDKTVSNIYSVQDSNLRTVKVLVPSRSQKQKHDITIEHVTDPDDPERFVEWTRIETRHHCSHKTNDFSFRFPKAVTYCPHDVAAYAALSRKTAEENRRIMPQPFPLFTEPYLRLYFSAAYHSLISDVEIKGGNPKVKLRPLNLPEIDTILMDAWLLHGNKQTLFVRSPTKQYKTGPPIGKRKRMRDYNWSSDVQGLPFGNE